MTLPCIGGPLEDLVAPKSLGLAFPWPEGWYYYARTHYYWREDPFLDQDAASWLADVLPAVDRANLFRLPSLHQGRSPE